ncbi:MAG: hypothetical protein ABJD38_04515 [Aurantimonas coralicida]
MAAKQIEASDAANLAARVGLGTAKLWMDHKSISIPPSSLPAAERSEKIEQSLSRYEELRNGYSGVSTVATGVKWGTGGLIAGVALYGGPQAAVTVPLTLIGAASAISLDLTNRKVEEIGNKRAGMLLSTLRNELVAESGAASLEGLLNNPELLRETVEKSDRFLRDVKERAQASNDDELVKTAAEALSRAGAAHTVATLDALGVVADDVDRLDRSFGEFASEVRNSQKRVQDTLVAHEGAIVSLSGDVTELASDVQTVREEVTKLGSNQGLMADFMFSSMPPSEKVRALRSGLMDSRIACPAEQTNCDAQTIKTALIEQYDGEARVAMRVQAAGQVLRGISDVQAITSNLGIPIGEDGQKAIDIASGALNAYMSFMSGNPLGAIASVTGMFGKKPDPDAERFKVMMGYLKEQFGAVNAKLDDILKNQKVLLDAVSEVSRQVQASYEALDARLSEMQVEQQRISNAVKSLVWREWEACYTVYAKAITGDSISEDDGSYVDRATLRFPSFDAARRLLDARAAPASDCIQTVLRTTSAGTASRWFGHFLDADRALNPERLRDPSTLSAAERDEANAWQGLLTSYRQNVVDPAFAVAVDFAIRHGASPSTLLFMNASPIEGVQDLATVSGEIGKGFRYQCTSRDGREALIRGLVCLPGESEDEIARDITSIALNTDILLDITDWMLVVSQLADLYAEDPVRFARDMDEVYRLPSYSHGEEITRASVDMLTLAIAYYARIHGGVTALAMAEDIRDGRLDDRLVRIAENSPYLAENAAHVYLNMLRGNWPPMPDTAEPSFADKYGQAYVYAQVSNEANRFEPLYALFGRDRPLTLTEQGAVGMQFSVGERNAVLPLPTPVRFAEGSFVYPPRRAALFAQRERMIERYLDYQLGEDTALAAVVLPQ